MAVVIGAGIAGMTTALALHRAGIPVEIHEQRKSVGGDHGTHATMQVFRHDGIPALQQLGLADQVESAGFWVRHLELRDETNEAITTFQAPDGGNVGITRAAIYQILQDAVAELGISIHYRHALRDIAVETTHARLTFRDGTTLDTDLVIGADGLNSAVRAAIASDATPTYTGRWYAHGITKTIETPTNTDTFIVVRHRKTSHTFGYITLDEGTRWWLRAHAPARHRVIDGADPQARAELLEYAPNAATADIINHAETDISTYDAHLIAPTNPWTDHGTLVLVGDAIHGANPAAGQAIGLATEDALTLARALRDSPDTPTALRRYERMRQNRAHRAIIAADPSNNLDGGPAYPLEWDTEITHTLAQQTQDQYRLPHELRPTR